MVYPKSVMQKYCIMFSSSVQFPQSAWNLPKQSNLCRLIGLSRSCKSGTYGLEITHLSHKVQAAAALLVSRYQRWPLDWEISFVGTVMKETRRQGGRQDIEVEKESVCGKGNTKVKTRGRRRYRTEVRGEREKNRQHMWGRESRLNSLPLFFYPGTTLVAQIYVLNFQLKFCLAYQYIS